MTAVTAIPALTSHRIDGASVWTGSEMRQREADWTYTLSVAQIAESRKPHERS